MISCFPYGASTTTGESIGDVFLLFLEQIRVDHIYIYMYVQSGSIVYNYIERERGERERERRERERDIYRYLRLIIDLIVR